MQRSCADVNSPYQQKCWTNSGGPLVNSLLWGSIMINNYVFSLSYAMDNMCYCSYINRLWLSYQISNVLRSEKRIICRNCLLHDCCLYSASCTIAAILHLNAVNVWKVSLDSYTKMLTLIKRLQRGGRGEDSLPMVYPIVKFYVQLIGFHCHSHVHVLISPYPHTFLRPSGYYGIFS